MLVHCGSCSRPGGSDCSQWAGQADPELLWGRFGVKQEEFAAGSLYVHDGLDGCAGSERVQHGGDGHAFGRTLKSEPAADIAASSPNEAWAADLHVFYFAIWHLGEDFGLAGQEDQELVPKEPHIIPLAWEEVCCWHIPAEVGHAAQADKSLPVEFVDLGRIAV